MRRARGITALVGDAGAVVVFAEALPHEVGTCRVCDLGRNRRPEAIEVTAVDAVACDVATFVEVFDHAVALQGETCDTQGHAFTERNVDSATHLEGVVVAVLDFDVRAEFFQFWFGGDHVDNAAGSALSVQGSLRST